MNGLYMKYSYQYVRLQRKRTSDCGEMKGDQIRRTPT